MSKTVFISSTSLDLQAHREATMKACLECGYHPIRMEDFVARAQDPLTACLDDIEKADIFIGIYAWRYGFIPENNTISITEMEFDHAQKLGKPCLCFWVDESYEWPSDYIEGGVGSQKLRHFQGKVHDSLIRATFSSPGDLHSKVAASLARLAQEQSPVPMLPQTAHQQVTAQTISHSNIVGRDFIQINNPYAEMEAIRQQLQQKQKQHHRMTLGHLTGGGLETPMFIGIGLVILLACVASQSTGLAIILAALILLGLGGYIYQWWQTRQHLAQQIQTLQAHLAAKQDELGS